MAQLMLKNSFPPVPGFLFPVHAKHYNTLECVPACSRLVVPAKRKSRTTIVRVPACSRFWACSRLFPGTVPGLKTPQPAWLSHFVFPRSRFVFPAGNVELAYVPVFPASPLSKRGRELNTLPLREERTWAREEIFSK